jgi:hypothetical protein
MGYQFPFHTVKCSGGLSMFALSAMDMTMLISYTTLVYHNHLQFSHRQTFPCLKKDRTGKLFERLERLAGAAQARAGPPSAARWVPQCTRRAPTVKPPPFTGNGLDKLKDRYANSNSPHRTPIPIVLLSQNLPSHLR